MSARPAIVFTILLAILLPIYFFVDRPDLAPSPVQEQQESLLKLTGIDAITLRRGKESLRYQKTSDGKLFQLTEPPNAFIPQDLMQALASLLIGAKQVEVVANDVNHLADFGLDHPQSEMTIEAPGRQSPIKIYFGADNPTHTAVYGQIEGVPKVFLLGNNLEYYQSLMFQWVEGKQGKKA
ncbi:MAG TPA: DUF4340 domain-containing protein [Candidatus Binataceae bacterium]|nr:DUF4340 domain-containing protein [Candidatus Binataceae bacterium]